MGVCGWVGICVCVGGWVGGGVWGCGDMCVCGGCGCVGVCVCGCGCVCVVRVCVCYMTRGNKFLHNYFFPPSSLLPPPSPHPLFLFSPPFSSSSSFSTSPSLPSSLHTYTFYDTQEDGIETYNRYLRNLGVLTRGSSSLLNTDQIPATFWITNPLNTFIGNAAAASRAYGFW